MKCKIFAATYGGFPSSVFVAARRIFESPPEENP